MSRQATDDCPDLGVIDHLRLIDRWSMRPSRIVKSEAKRVVARCAVASCNFTFQARGRKGEYIITRLSPHDCTISEIQPRQRAIKSAHLPLQVRRTILSGVSVNCRRKGGGSSAKAIQANCKSLTGVTATIDQINRLRKSSPGLAADDVLQKLQILPSVLEQIKGTLPNFSSIIQTSELSHQLHSAAQRAHDSLMSSLHDFNPSQERSIQSLFFGERDIVEHLQQTVGHGIYTADAAHCHRPSVGYDCIMLLITRRLGDGKIVTPAFCLTTLNESEETWSNFFIFCMQYLGMPLAADGTVLVGDMQKGLLSACQKHSITHRECLVHIFHRMEEQRLFIKSNDHSIGAFFNFAKATTPEMEEKALSVLRDHHLKPEAEDAFLQYWHLHSDRCSGQSAVDEGIDILNHFTSNNSETINSSGSINKSFQPHRAMPWVDFVMHNLSKTRSFFADGQRSTVKAIAHRGSHGLSNYAIEKIAGWKNYYYKSIPLTCLLYSCVFPPCFCIRFRK